MVKKLLEEIKEEIMEELKNEDEQLQLDPDTEKKYYDLVQEWFNDAI